MILITPTEHAGRILENGMGKRKPEEVEGLLEQFAYSFKNMGRMIERPECFDSEEIRAFYESALLANMTTRNDMLVELREAKAEARREGLAEGMAEGRAEGLAGVARQMKAEGMDPGLIARLTGLPLEKIAGLE